MYGHWYECKHVLRVYAVEMCWSPYEQSICGIGFVGLVSFILFYGTVGRRVLCRGNEEGREREGKVTSAHSESEPML